MKTEELRKNGPALAAVVAAGIGSFVLGLFTTLAEVSASLKDRLVLSEPVGPLSGKTTIGVLAFAIAWVILGVMWRDKDVDSKAVVIATAVLVGLGLLMTFPTFFEQFAAE